MKIREISEKLCADIVCGEDQLDCEVFTACSSDMMSDVLAFVKDQAVLLTGLVNPQVIRTAEMKCLAEEAGIVLMKTQMRMFEACGILYEAGLKGHVEDGVCDA